MAARDPLSLENYSRDVFAKIAHLWTGTREVMRMGNKKYLHLKCGQNPDEPGGGKYQENKEWEENGATFSRFVLPFAYWKRDYKGERGPLWFEQAKDSLDPPLQSDLLIERKKYFSYETRRVLFDDALWLQVPESRWNQSTWANGACFTNSQNFEKKTFCIKMSPPRMVLFGWNAEDRKPGLLQTGFLLVDIWFPEGQDVILDDILCLNDLFRCFDYPGFEEHWEYYKEALSNIPLKYQGKPSKVERIGHLKDDERYRAYIERWTRLLELPVKIEDRYYSLVPQDLTDRAVVILGIYELLYTKLDTPVVINEAVEVAKMISGGTSYRFVNAVLDKVAKEVRNGL